MARVTAAQARADIVAVAARLFALRGYEATSLQDIADELGGSKAAVLYHFGTKAAILSELMRPAAAALRELLESLDGLTGDEQRRTAALGLVNALITFRNELASYPAAILRIAEIPELADLGFEPLGLRLQDALSGGSTEVVDLAATITMISGVLSAAQALSDHHPDELHAALEAIALRTLGL